MTTMGVCKGRAAVAVGSGVAVAATVAVGVGVRVGVGLSIVAGEGAEVEVNLGAGVGSDVGVAEDTGALVEVAIGVLVRFRNSDSGCSGPEAESVHPIDKANRRTTGTARVIRNLYLQCLVAVITGQGMCIQPTISILLPAPSLSQGSFVP